MRSFSHWSSSYIISRLLEIYYRSKNPDAPWLTAHAVNILDGLLKNSDIGVEFGSGRSTIWLAKRSLHLTSIEHDEAWFSKVKNLLSQQQLNNVTYHYFPKDFPEAQADRSPYLEVLNELSSESVDFVLVDGAYRDFCALGAIRVLRPGGLLIIDNVNWYLPSRSSAPNSRTLEQGPKGTIWAEVHERIGDWRTIWTTSGVTDTALFIKPINLDQCSGYSSQA